MLLTGVETRGVLQCHSIQDAEMHGYLVNNRILGVDISAKTEDLVLSLLTLWSQWLLIQLWSMSAPMWANYIVQALAQYKSLRVLLFEPTPSHV
jgi:hypothetical protein